MTQPCGDLGFVARPRPRKNGDVDVLHHGRVAATLRGAKAQAFLAELAVATRGEEQLLMARVTGNYKRGNERAASRHPRNSRG